MKVAELRRQLSFFDDEQEVFFAFPSGDYWGTTQAHEVDEVSEEKVVWSDYHRTHKLVDEDREDRYEDDELKEVVVLS